MIQFYSSDIASTPVLPEAESTHAIRVLRMREGDYIRITDGCGKIFHSTITDAHPKRTLVTVNSIEEIDRPWPVDITIAVAPTKSNDRMEWLMEKLVEIGINRFTPLLCRHSERKELKSERLRKIAISAMNQSLKAWLPQIDELTQLRQFIAEPTVAQKFVGYCDDTVERRLLSTSLLPDRDTRILIGPEGDFSKEEIAMVINNGYVATTFGDTRLRTETAALVSAQTVHVINQLK